MLYLIGVTMSYALRLSSFGVNDRVELAPHTATWMRGDRFGRVTAVGAERVTVLLDRSRHTTRVLPADIHRIVDTEA